jgi:hypothetical protein
VVDPTFFGNTLIEIVSNLHSQRTPRQRSASTKNRERAKIEILWLCQKSWGEYHNCECLPHFPDLTLCMGGFQQSLSLLTVTDWCESAMDTCTWPDFSDRGPPPKWATKTMCSCCTTAHRRNLKIFEHTLRGNSIASPDFLPCHWGMRGNFYFFASGFQLCILESLIFPH